MPVRRNPIDIGSDRARLLHASVCREIEGARIDRGLSYAALGRAVGRSGQQLARICQGRAPSVSLTLLARLAALVGLELAARTYPGGQPLRDGAQQALLTRFRRRLDRRLDWQMEVPVIAAPTAPRDLRAWDAVVGGRGWRAGIEAETHVDDVQALLRRIELKRRDGQVEGGIVLVLNDSRHHRELVKAAAMSLGSAFPVSARLALARLRRGEPPGDAIVLL